MSIVLAVVYGLTIVVYIPLYSTVMERLRVAFPEFHLKLYRKVNVGFILMMVLVTLRYAIYLSLQFASFKFFQISQLRAYVPFYVSELIIAAVYIVFLTRINNNNRQPQMTEV
jgi:hypothetical protein